MCLTLSATRYGATCTAAWIGLVVHALRPLYDYAWFIGFGVAAVTHLILMKVMPPRDIVEATPAPA